jgi:hypothetical protein
MRVFKMTRQLGLRVRDRTSQSLYFMRMLQPFPWVPKDDPVKSERAVASAGANWAGQSAEREKRRKKKEKKRRKELLQEQADEKAFMDWLTAPRQQPNGHAHSKCTPGACASPLLGGECSVHVHVGCCCGNVKFCTRPSLALDCRGPRHQPFLQWCDG